MSLSDDGGGLDVVPDAVGVVGHSVDVVVRIEQHWCARTSKPHVHRRWSSSDWHSNWNCC